MKCLDPFLICSHPNLSSNVRQLRKTDTFLLSLMQYQLGRLEHLCTQYIEASITTENVLVALECAEDLCLEFIKVSIRFSSICLFYFQCFEVPSLLLLVVFTSSAYGTCIICDFTSPLFVSSILLPVLRLLPKYVFYLPFPCLIFSISNLALPSQAHTL